jgi:Putative abortive phage resistance protein AbiGi, antitoxin
MNKIIHFTREFDYISGILESKSLKFFYCKEDFRVNDQLKSRAAHPMVCFCHFNSNSKPPFNNSYGNYGIEFSEKWAIKKKVSPVVYIEQKSQLSTALDTLLKARRDKKLYGDLSLSIILIKCYTKNLIGYNSKLKVKNFNFKDENEWRYVPLKKEIEGNFISINRKDYVNKKDYHNDLISKYSLKFNDIDIQKIYVENDNEKFIIHQKFNIALSKIEINT